MIDKGMLIEDIKFRLFKLEEQASKYRKGRDGHNMHKMKARKDELTRLLQYIENGTYDIRGERE